MTDILTRLSDDGPDWVIEDGDLVLDQTLRTTVLLALFSDERAELEDELPEGETDRRGYWGDTATERFGSRLWLLRREKIVPATLRSLEDAVEGALGFLLELGIADEVTATAERGGAHDRVEITLRIRRGRARRWSTLWEKTAESTLDVGNLTVRLVPEAA